MKPVARFVCLKTRVECKIGEVKLLLEGHLHENDMRKHASGNSVRGRVSFLLGMILGFWFGCSNVGIAVFRAILPSGQFHPAIFVLICAIIGGIAMRAALKAILAAGRQKDSPIDQRESPNTET